VGVSDADADNAEARRRRLSDVALKDAAGLLGP
jgi:hypothetical protein